MKNLSYGVTVEIAVVRRCNKNIKNPLISKQVPFDEILFGEQGRPTM